MNNFNKQLGTTYIEKDLASEGCNFFWGAVQMREDAQFYDSFYLEKTQQKFDKWFYQVGYELLIFLHFKNSTPTFLISKQGEKSGNKLHLVVIVLICNYF